MSAHGTRIAGALLTAAAVVAFRLPLFRLQAGFYDEGLIALGAEQVLKGHWPLVDFYAPYPPGAFFAVAGFYELFGVGVLIERAVSLGLVAVAAALAYLLVTGFETDCARPRARLVAAAIPLVTAAIYFGPTWVPPQVAGAFAFLFAAGLALRAALRTGRLLGAAATGALLGVMALWRADLALYGALAAGLVWLTRAPAPATGGASFLAPSGEGRGGSAVRRRRLGFAAMAGAAGAVAFPVFALFIALGGRRAFEGLLVWPVLGTYHAMLPWPALFPRAEPPGVQAPLLTARLSGWPFYFPVLAAALSLFRLWKRSDACQPERDVELWLALTACGMGVYAGGRSDVWHVRPLVFVSLVLVASAARGLLARGRWYPLAVLLPALVALGLPPLETLITTPERRLPRAELPFARGRGILLDPATVQNYRLLIDELRSLPPGEPIFSGTTRHDLFMVNDSLLYLLAERDPGTYYWCLDAGVTTRAAVQRQMIADLDAHGVHRVLRLSSFVVSDSSPSAEGSRLLDERLQAAFVSTKRIGPYELLSR